MKFARQTNPCFAFVENVARALVLPTLKYGPESDDDWAVSDTEFLYQAALTQVITSLEVYYELVFRILSSTLTISQVDPSALVHFIKDNKLWNELLNAIIARSTIDVPLSDVVPEHFPFQQKDKIKGAMALVRLDPISSYGIEWERTFGMKEDSTLNLRHASVHGGVRYGRILTLVHKEDKFVINRIKDAVVLVENIETQISEKYAGIKALFPIEHETAHANGSKP